MRKCQEARIGMQMSSVICDRRVLVTLIAILVVASSMRFYGLETQSLWNDELSSWYRSSHEDLATVINVGVRPDVHPPGYQVLLYFVEQYLGESPSALRFPSAASGVLSVFVIFLIGLRLYSYREGLIAAALMAVAWCPIYYSQEARAYSMLLLSTLLATYFWLSVVQRLNVEASLPLYSSLGYIIAAIASSYLHYFGLYLIALQGLGAVLLLLKKHRALLRIFLIYLFIIVAYMPWLPTMREHISKGPIWIDPPTITAFVALLGFFFNGSKPLLLVVLGLYSLPIVHRLYKSFREEGRSALEIAPLSPDMILVLWLIVPFVGAFAKSVFSAPVLTYKNLIISLPAAYLLLARSITRFPLSTRLQTLSTVMIVGLFLFDLLFGMSYYWRPQKEQFREAVQYVADREHLYEDALIIGCASAEDYFNYYFERSNSSCRVNVLGFRDTDVPEIRELISSVNPRYLWYIRGGRVPDAEFFDFLRNNLTLVQHEEFIGTDVWLFQNDKWPFS